MSPYAFFLMQASLNTLWAFTPTFVCEPALSLTTCLHQFYMCARAPQEEYASSADAASARFARDYVKRTLMRLAADSGDEN